MIATATCAHFRNIVENGSEFIGRERRRYSMHSIHRAKTSAIHGQHRNRRARQQISARARITDGAAYHAMDRREVIEIADRSRLTAWELISL